MKKRKFFKQVIAVLNWPSDILNFIAFAKLILIAMLSKPVYAGSMTKLTKLGTDIGVLEENQQACSANLPTASIADRDAAREVVEEDLRELRIDVQILAKKDPINAIALIEDTGMTVKILSSPGKQQNTVQDGNEEGSVFLTAEGAGPHKWRMSLNDKDFTLLDPTMQASTTVKNLTLGEVYYFQNCRLLRNKEEGEWSQSVKIRVR